MAIKYTYTIDRIVTVPKWKGFVDAITDITYTYTGTDGTGDNKVVGSTSQTVQLEEPNETTFVSYDDLTEAQVRDWIKSIVNVEKNKLYVQERIADKRNTIEKAEKPLPWVSN